MTGKREVDSVAHDPVGSKPCTVHLHMLLWLVPTVITLVNVRMMFKFH